MKNISTFFKVTKSLFFNYKSSKIFLIVLLVLFGVSNAFAQTVTYTTGSGNFTVPCGVTSLTVQIWGGGGAGGAADNNPNGGSGGGAGGYSTAILVVVPGDIIAYSVGNGGVGNGGAGTTSSFGAMLTNGGSGGGQNQGAIGVGGTASGGTTNTPGGNGGTGTTTLGAAGGNAQGGGGTGGAARTGFSSNGNDGNIPGGGGGGALRISNFVSGRTGGDGARGEIRITYTNVIPANPANPTSNSPQCNTTGVTLSRTGTPPVGVAWYWQVTALGTDTTNSTSNDVVNASGTYYLRAQNIATGCWSTGSGGVVVVVNQPPGAIAGGAATVCSGSNTPAFTNPNPGGTWSVTSGTGTATITSPGGILTGGSAGTVTVVYTIGSCVPATYNVTVNPTPTAIGGGAAAVCTGTDSPAFTNATAGGTWSVTNGTGSATIDNTTGVVTGVTAGTVTVVYTIGVCSVTRVLTVQQTPGAIAGGAATVCVGSITPAFTNPNAGGTWSVTSGTGTATINNGTRVLTGVTAGTVTVVYTIGSCVPATYNVTVNPTPTAIGGGAATVCTGTVSPAFTNATPGGTWSVTNGTGSATIDNATGVVTGVTAGTVTVVYTVAACSVSRVLTVQQTPGPITGGGATVCVGSLTPAFVNSIGGGAWSVIYGTGTATINNATRVLMGLSAGTVTVVYAIGNCKETYAVTVNALPVITAQPAITTICTTASGTFSVAATGATTYQWRKNNVPLTNVAPYSGVDTPTLTITNPTAGAAGNFDVTVGNGNCSVTSAQRALTVTTVPAAVSAPTPANNATGVCYSGSGAISSISWGAVATATSYDVYFGTGSVPATITANVATPTYTTGALLANMTYYWRIVAKNSCGDALSSAPYTFTTSAIPCYCVPSVSTNAQAQTNYLYQVNFLGTLLDTFNTSAYSTAPRGYQDFTGLTPKSIQADGNGMNIYMASTISGFYKVWVDWDKNGIFSDAEVVYNSNGIAQASTTVGIVIPVGTPPGDYRMRLRVNGQIIGNNINGDSNASSCGNLNYPGETEDYLFTVVANCSANIATAPRTSRCGSGSVKLEPTASAGVTEFRWYSSGTGGSPIATTTATGNTTSWDTPSISATTTYYVTAFNGCESLFRTPMVAVINALPIISFSPDAAEVCGNDVVIAVSATGSNQVEYLINENFTNGLNGFTNQLLSGSNGTNAAAAWQVRSSIFTPTLFSWYPAISSGINGNKFVMATSDVGVPGLNTENALVSPVKNTTNFVNLTLNFKIYYSRYYPDGTNLTADFVNVEVATNAAGTNWVLIPGAQPNPSRITTDVGIGTKFTQLSYNLGNYLNQPNLRIRIRYHGEWCDGVAVDDVELFGEKPLTPSFSWTSNNPIAFYSDAAATTLYTGTPASIVYIKPTSAQMEMYENWTVSATATLSNGCSASGIVTVENNNKVWNAASSNWNNSDWYPGGTGLPPTADQCVIIKQPVVLGTGAAGWAKNVRVEVGGKLTINPNQTLTVTDAIINNAGDANFVVQSDGNLLQINPSKLINSGNITAERSVTNIDYNPGTFIDYVYWSSPVAGQQTKGAGGFSPGTPNNRFYDYRESNDRFYETPDLTFTAAKGYAVQAETNLGTSYGKTYMFKGAPNNGDFNIALTKSADNPVGVVHGYNLIGNPYPSNIDFNELYLGNSALIYNSAWFWTNISYEQYQMGYGYGGNNYAVLNGTGGVPYTANGKVSVGQGFIVQAKANGTLTFKNSYSSGHDLRVSSSATFFQKENAAKNRFWINLTAPSQIVNSQLIGYVVGATNDYEQDYDAEAFDNYSDLFYSILPDKKLLIQGKTDQFSVEDRVPVGANFFQNGTYAISLGNAEGIFEDTQNIYLLDKETGTITNLSEGAYTFTAVKGDTNGRFEIIYKPEVVLVTDSASKEGIVVYRDSDNFVIQSPKLIAQVEVYDASGRLITVLKPNKKQGILDASAITNGMYVLKITTIDGEVTNRKISR